MELKSLVILAVVFLAFTATACTVSGQQSAGSEPTGITPSQNPGSTQSPPNATSPGEEGGNISSRGKTSVPTPTGTVGNLIPGSLPRSFTATPRKSTPPAPSSAWETYRDDTYKFELQYPPTYVIVQARAGAQPAPVAQVWFQDRELANSPTANVQPPQFAIDIYGNSKQLNAADWVKENSPIVPGGSFETSPIEVGGVAGIRAQTTLLLAPNTFVFVARGALVFKITPLGPYSDQMLAGFKFL